MAARKPIAIQSPHPFAEVDPATDTLDAKVQVSAGQRLLGRETGAGAHEEIEVGSGLSLAAGVLASSGGLTSTVSGTITLTSGGWSANTQNATVTGVTTTSVNIIVIESATMGDRWGEAKVYATGQAANQITFTCVTTPTDPIEIKVVILK